MVSIQVLATPISGLRRSASVNPMALNMERAGARSRPSVMPRLRCFRSMAKDYNRNVLLQKTPEKLVIRSVARDLGFSLRRRVSHSLIPVLQERKPAAG